MSNLPLSIFFADVITIGIGYTTIFLLASLGEIYAEKSGVLNLSLEGIMSMGAFFGYSFAILFNNPYFGLLGGILAGLLLGIIFAYISITLGVNQVLAGLSIWLVGIGISDFLYTLTFGRSMFLLTAPTLKNVPIPYLSDLPVIGKMFFDHTIIDYTAYILVPVLWYFLYKTKTGLKIISVGENPRAADSVGINVNKVRYATVLFGSIMSGLSGSYIALTVGLYQVGIIAGRGWISIGIAAFSGLNPAYGLLGSLLFGLISALGPSFMIIGYKIPYEFLDITPFLALIVVVMLISKRMRVPSGHGQPYKRE